MTISELLTVPPQTDAPPTLAERFGKRVDRHRTRSLGLDHLLTLTGIWVVSSVVSLAMVRMILPRTLDLVINYGALSLSDRGAQV